MCTKADNLASVSEVLLLKMTKKSSIRNITLDSEDVNTAVYKHCQSISSKGKPQSDLSGYLSSLKTH